MIRLRTLGCAACLWLVSLPLSAATLTLVWDPVPETSEEAPSGYLITQDGQILGETIDAFYVVTLPDVDTAPHTFGVASFVDWMIAGRITSDTILISDVPPQVSPPTTSAPSPDLTTIPPASSIDDGQGGTWTIDPNDKILVNGVSAAGGSGSVLVWKSSTLYAWSVDRWWQWTGTDWTDVGLAFAPPNAAPEPTPPPVDPCVATPLAVTVTAWPAGQSGRRSGTWASTFTLVSADFLWKPQRFVAVDDRGCTVTVTK